MSSIERAKRSYGDRTVMMHVSRRVRSGGRRSIRSSAWSGSIRTRGPAARSRKRAGETIPIGGAGLIVAYKHTDAQTVEPAVARAVKKVVGEAEGHHVKALKGALAEA